MSIDKIKPEDYEVEEKCDFGKNMGDDICRAPAGIT